MSRTLSVSLVLAIAFLGVADSWYLAQTAFSGAALACDFGAVLDGCNAVATSKYSHLFGLPLGLYGVAFYAALFVLAGLLVVFHARRLYQGLFGAALLGLLASIAFVSIQVFLIRALCVYCLASAGLSFLAFLIAWHLLARFAPARLAKVAEA
jgi:uncharacterized membrane protein